MPITTVQVSLTASILDYNEISGTVTLAIPARELTVTETEMLEQLFPHFEKVIGNLLREETVLAAIVK